MDEETKHTDQSEDTAKVEKVVEEETQKTVATAAHNDGGLTAQGLMDAVTAIPEHVINALKETGVFDKPKPPKAAGTAKEAVAPAADTGTNVPGKRTFAQKWLGM